MVFFLTFVVLLLFFVNCSKKTDSDKIKIVATIEPIKFISEQIIKDKGIASSIISSNQDPHSLELVPLNMKSVETADIVFFLGSNLEFEEKNSQAIIDNSKNTLFVFLSEGIDSVFNPHIWVSLKNLKIIAKMICEEISHYDEENRDYYSDNYHKYVSRLDSIEKSLSDAIEKRKLKSFFADHIAFSYFARDYSLEQIAIFEEGKEPSLKDISQIVGRIKLDKDKILIMTNLSSSRFADIFRNETQCEIVYFNPLVADIADEFLKLTDFLKNE
ncbi:MAG: hypothetical protein COX48_05270 [bacterium (Candidatus Stahlbacteria) CG23_combo_of_CG06-09_8_20_14_all_34_7]|nr:MAG: hypothetical protein COX48_05270 [bacterium (Candidatus Stahlbacteria) CG23_combo_of_CG06-09_8_20_14_all_34_7]